VEKILLARQDDLIINILVKCSDKDFLLCDHENPINEAYAGLTNILTLPTRRTLSLEWDWHFTLKFFLQVFLTKK